MVGVGFTAAQVTKTEPSTTKDIVGVVGLTPSVDDR